jgi:hypothetical protein
VTQGPLGGLVAQEVCDDVQVRGDLDGHLRGTWARREAIGVALDLGGDGVQAIGVRWMGAVGAVAREVVVAREWLEVGDDVEKEGRAYRCFAEPPDE